MTYEQWRWAQELTEIFPAEYDAAYEPIWHAHWADYEECARIYVLEKAGVYYVQEYAYSVMSDDNTVRWDPYAVTYERLCEILTDWEEHLD